MTNPDASSADTNPEKHLSIPHAVFHDHDTLMNDTVLISDQQFPIRIRARQDFLCAHLIDHKNGLLKGLIKAFIVDPVMITQQNPPICQIEEAAWRQCGPLYSSRPWASRTPKTK